MDKRKGNTRKYNFTDTRLVLLAHQKAGFMLRDAAEFSEYGITAADVQAMIAQAEAFSAMVTDGEAHSDVSIAASLKVAKADELRKAIRNVMVRVARIYPSGSPVYRAFGTGALARQPDNTLMITAKTVDAVGKQHSAALAVTGLTETMLAHIVSLANELETLLLDLRDMEGNRTVLKSERIAAGNALYTTLMAFCKTGRNIWEDVSAAKASDYVVHKG